MPQADSAGRGSCSPGVGPPHKMALAFHLLPFKVNHSFVGYLHSPPLALPFASLCFFKCLSPPADAVPF
jgi:hypothetical protein